MKKFLLILCFLMPVQACHGLFDALPKSESDYKISRGVLAFAGIGFIALGIGFGYGSYKQHKKIKELLEEGSFSTFTEKQLRDAVEKRLAFGIASGVSLAVSIGCWVWFYLLGVPKPAREDLAALRQHLKEFATSDKAVTRDDQLGKNILKKLEALDGQKDGFTCLGRKKVTKLIEVWNDVFDKETIGRFIQKRIYISSDSVSRSYKLTVEKVKDGDIRGDKVHEGFPWQDVFDDMFSLGASKGRKF